MDFIYVYAVEGGLLLHSRRSCPAVRSELPYRERAGAQIRESRVTSTPAPHRLCRLCWDSADGASVVEDVDLASTVSIEIARDRVDAIQGSAVQRHTEMAGHEVAYGVTSPERQFTGLLGEAAVLLWLVEALAGEFEFWGEEPGGADVYLRSKRDGLGWTRIEVKTHDVGFWYEHGRMVNGRQLQRMNADLIVWCVAPKRPERWSLATESVSRTNVFVVGWSPVEDCRATGVPERFVHWANVRVHARLRPPAELIAWLAGGRTSRWDSG